VHIKARLLLPVASLTAVMVAVACAPPPPSGPTIKGATTTAASSVPHSSTTVSGTTTSTTTTSTTTTLPPTTTTVPDTKGLYSATPVDGWGILREGTNDQYVDSVKVVGDAVYAVGAFAHAVHSGLVVPRANVMAVQASTGDLLPFVADTNGPVYAVTSDGTSLYLGGDFTTVNGAPHNRLAKVDLTSGAVDPAFKAGTGGIVRDLLVIGGKLYAVGEFNLADGFTRHHAAVVNTTNGGIDPSFNPNVDGKVLAVAASPDGTKVYLGGNFTLIGATPKLNLAEVNPVTGQAEGPDFEKVNDDILDLSVRSDGSQVYGGGAGKLNSAIAWDATTGTQQWRVHVDGDTQAVQYSDGYVYMGFHDGYLGNTALRLLAVDADTGLVDPTFQPSSNGLPGVYALDADGHHLVAGGYFSTMGGVSVKGLAVFP
jgi:Domain of unknown function (DUF5122) beta-propeller